MSNNEGVYKSNINWYPGHMAKTKRQVSEILNTIDIVYEIIDARMPYSSKIKDIDNFIKNQNKIIIMTKYDLCDKQETQKWIEYYKKNNYEVIPVNLNETNQNKILTITKNILKEKNISLQNKGMINRKMRALVIGIPNVGKSTLINRLVGKKAVSVGNKPGITKKLDWIRINKDIELLDTPGILWPKFDNETIGLNLASFSAIKEEVLPIDQVVIHILKTLKQYYPSILEKRYGIMDIDFDAIEKTYDEIGKKRGCLTKGGIVDYDKVNNIILSDIKDGNIKGVTFDRYDG